MNVNQENCGNGQPPPPLSFPTKHLPRTTSTFPRSTLQDLHTNVHRKNFDSNIRVRHCNVSSTSGTLPIIEGIGGLDTTTTTNSLLVLRRMEEVILVWYHKISRVIDTYRSDSYDSNPSLEGDIQTLRFCTTVLMKIITGGNMEHNIPPDTSTPLWQRPLPPIDQLPYIVTTVQYWYCHHLSIHRHQMVVQKIQSKLFPATNVRQSMSFDKYVTDCNDTVKEWLGDTVFSTCGSGMATTTTDASSGIHPQTNIGLVTSVDSPNLTVSCCDVRDRTTYEPGVNDRTFISIVTDTAFTKDSQVRNHDSTIVEAEHDVIASRLKNNVKTNLTNDETSGSVERNKLHTTISCPSQKTNIDDYKFRWCGLVLNLYHAWKCPFNDSDCITLAHRRCTILRGCRTAKDLYRHIRTNTCDASDCIFGSLCQDATDAFRHFQNCQSELCPVCGPVRRHIPNIKQTIQEATDRALREVESVESAQRTIMQDTVKIYQSMSDASSFQCPKTKILPHKCSVLCSPSPSIPRTIGVLKRSDDQCDSIEKMVQGPTKKRCSSNYTIC